MTAHVTRHMSHITCHTPTKPALAQELPSTPTASRVFEATREPTHVRNWDLLELSAQTLH